MIRWARPHLRALLDAVSMPVIAAMMLSSFGVAARLRAQERTPRESLLWLAYFGRFELTPRWAVLGEAHERRWVETFRAHQRVWRMHIQRGLTKRSSLSVGYTYFQQGVQNPELPALPLVAEHRPHVQTDLTMPLTSRIGFNQRLRGEWRLLPVTVGGVATGDHFSAGRFRYRLGMDLRTANSSRAPVVRVSNEFHMMFGDRPLTFDQNRVQAGVELKVAKSLSAELAYLWWHQRQRSGTLLDRDYLRVTINHRIRQ